MNTKLEKKTTLPKLSVDQYTEDGDNLVCDCYTPGKVGEDSYLTRVVTMQALEDHVASKGMVDETHFNDTQEVEGVLFATWYADNKHTEYLNCVLADIINKMEGRKAMIGLPDLEAAINKALSTTGKIIHHLQARA